MGDSLYNRSMAKCSPKLLIHGGAWAMPDSDVPAHERGIANALDAGYAVLSRGGSSLDAVEAAIVVMEDDETFDAGRGSFLTRDGRVQLDALLMNGENLRTGGVACVEHLRNPIRAARLVLDESPHVYFVGSGAERFATQHGRLRRNFWRRSLLHSVRPAAIWNYWTENFEASRAKFNRSASNAPQPK